MVRRESRRGLDSLRMPVGGILVLSVGGEKEEGFALGRRGGEGGEWGTDCETYDQQSPFQGIVRRHILIAEMIT